MARGDLVYFDQFYLDEGLAVHNLDVHTYKWGLVTNAVVPSRSTPDPRWGAGGSTNFSAQEVTSGGPGSTYPAGGTDLQSTFSGLPAPTHGASVVSWPANADNPTDAAYAIGYNDTAGGKQCVCFVDLGGPLDMRAGPLTLTPNPLGLGVKGASAGPV